MMSKGGGKTRKTHSEKKRTPRMERVKAEIYVHPAIGEEGNCGCP